MNPYESPLTCDKPGVNPLLWLAVEAVLCVAFLLAMATFCAATVLAFPVFVGFLVASLIPLPIKTLRQDRIYTPLAWSCTALGCFWLPAWWTWLFKLTA